VSAKTGPGFRALERSAPGKKNPFQVTSMAVKEQSKRPLEYDKNFSSAIEGRKLVSTLQ